MITQDINIEEEVLFVRGLGALIADNEKLLKHTDNTELKNKLQSEIQQIYTLLKKLGYK